MSGLANSCTAAWIDEVVARTSAEPVSLSIFAWKKPPAGSPRMKFAYERIVAPESCPLPPTPTSTLCVSALTSDGSVATLNLCFSW